MKRSRILVVLGSLSLALSLSSAAPKPEGSEVLVAADAIVAPEGFRPSPGKPVYYIFSQVSHSLGESIAGVRLPDPAFIERTVVAELAKQGFVRTQVGGPMPSVLILATSGAANFQASPDADDLDLYRSLVQPSALRHIPEDDVQAPTYLRYDGVAVEDTMRYRASEAMAQDYKYRASPRFRDQSTVEAIMGTQKMFSSNSVNSPNGLKVAAASNEDRLYISVSALDAQLFAKKEKKLLWRTSMSVGWRHDFTATLPTLLASGGPFFGTDVKTPVFLDDRERRNFEVKIGESTTVPDSAKPNSQAGRTN